MPSRITIVFTMGERAALDELARREYRDVRQQAAVIIRRELQWCGLLPANDVPGHPPQELRHAPVN